MLEELRVTNFAVIDSLQVRFGKGLNVITGETGAGKSIMIQAISGLIGERLEQSVIRTGKEKATIEGMFHLSTDITTDLNRIGLTVENPIIIRRIIGSGRAGYINDSPVAIQTLRRLGRRIVELLGQHEQQLLFSTDNHRRFLDTFIGLGDQLAKLQTLYDEYVAKRNDYLHYQEEMERLKEQKDLLTYQLEELKRTDIKPGEEEILSRKLDLLKSAEKRKKYITEILQYLYDGKDSAYELLSRISELLSKLAVVDPAVKKDYDDIQEVLIRAEELGRDITNYHENIEFSTEQLDEIAERLDTIRRLKKKYGDLDAIENLKLRLGKDLEGLKDYPFDLEKRKEELDDWESRLNRLALDISKKRKRGARRLENQVIELLKGLKIIGQFSCKFEETPVGPAGIDNIEFFISVNPGETPRPLRKVASGGELSRIALILKSLLADLDQTPILIFDEIDAGIGGRVGELVGLKLAEISRHHQVICITHLPQIAKFADHHFLVDKSVRRGRTYTSLKTLNDDERRLELARMIGGKKVTPVAVEKAQEMIEEARCLRSQT